MPTVEYLPVAAAGGANVESQGSFAGSSHQLTGFVAGIALSAQLNKCWRQSSVVAAALANLIADITGQNVLDDGNVTNLLQQLSLMTVLAPFMGTSGGSANVQTLTPTVAVPAYITGQLFRFVAGFTNTAAATLNVSGLGAIAFRRATALGPVALVGGELVAGNQIEAMYDGTFMQILSAPTSLNPTILKKGTNAGNYSSASGSYVDVDNTTLKLVVTIPVGHQLVVLADGTIAAPAGPSISVTTYVAIAVDGTVVQQQLMQDSNGSPSQTPFSLSWVIAGDNLSHSITLQYKMGGGSGDDAIITNNSDGGIPTMLFKME